MGTSGAYGGTKGWSGVGNQTQAWLDGGAGTGPDDAGDAANGDGQGNAPAGSPTDRPDSASDRPESDQNPPVTPQLTALLGRLGRRVSGSGGGGGGGFGSGGSGGFSGGSDSGSGSRGRSSGRASSVGGRAAAGVYGLRSGTALPLADLGLSLEDLRGLSKHQQARKLLEAAMGPSGGVAESELRLANADLILWALNEEEEPAPIDLANRWVVEYVWQVWITEAGPTVRNHAANGYDSLRVKQEMRAALEATVAGGGLPDDRPLTTQDFEHTIDSALKSLGRIGGATR